MSKATLPRPSLEDRRDAYQLVRGFRDMIHRGDRMLAPTLAALAFCFLELAGTSTEDPMGLMGALEKSLLRGDWGLEDDPAKGRYVHPEHESVQ